MNNYVFDKDAVKNYNNSRVQVRMNHFVIFLV